MIWNTIRVPNKISFSPQAQSVRSEQTTWSCLFSSALDRLVWQPPELSCVSSPLSPRVNRHDQMCLGLPSCAAMAAEEDVHVCWGNNMNPKCAHENQSVHAMRQFPGWRCNRRDVFYLQEELNGCEEGGFTSILEMNGDMLPVLAGPCTSLHLPNWRKNLRVYASAPHRCHGRLHHGGKGRGDLSIHPTSPCSSLSQQSPALQARRQLPAVVGKELTNLKGWMTAPTEPPGTQDPFCFGLGDTEPRSAQGCVRPRLPLVACPRSNHLSVGLTASPGGIFYFSYFVSHRAPREHTWMLYMAASLQ